MSNEFGFGGFGGFGDLGIFGNMVMMESDEPKKEDKKKKAAKSKEKKDSSKAKTSVTKYKAPLKVIFDSTGSVEITEEKEYTKEELLGQIASLSGISLFETEKEKFALTNVKGNIYIVRPSYSASYEKGSDGKKLLLSEVQELVTLTEPNEEGNFEVEAVKNYIKETYGMEVKMYLVGDTYIPVPKTSKNDPVDDMKFPVKITALTLFGEMIELEEEAYKEFKEEALKSGEVAENKRNEDDEEDDEPEASFLPVEKPKKKEKVLSSVIEKILITFLPDYADDLVFNYTAESNLLQVMHKSVNSNASPAPASVKKEDTYPSDVTLSILFTRFELNSSMFGGKDKITKKDVVKFLSKTYPEYSMERTVLEYDEKKKLLIAVPKSGKRGAYSLEEDEIFRRECSEMMDIEVSDKTAGRDMRGCYPGTVNFKLPKIPFKILQECLIFFWSVYVCKKTEAIAQIFYNKEEGEYEVYFPLQYTSSAGVEFERDLRRETDENLIQVMEIHSHARFSAFWSGTDNSDEKAHRLYGVVGNIPEFYYDNKHIMVRGATGGYHVRVALGDVFEFPTDLKEVHCALDRVRPLEESNLE